MHIAISGFGKPSVIPEFPSSNSILLVMIPIVAAAISIIIWKKRKD
jgi:hypothetical protein